MSSLVVIPEADLLIDTTPAGLLGEGSFGLVRRATWRGTPFAAKSLQKSASDVGDAPARAFDREIEVLARLRHPNVIAVFGVCHHADGRSTLVMELATGGTLHTRLHPGEGSAGVRLPLGELAAIAQGISRALTFAHAAGVTHNDLKSSNVLFNSGGLALLSDFGLVKRVRAALPGTYAALLGSSSGGGGLLGTLQWAAPENFDDESPHHGQPPGDVYSLGLLMYEMATGLEPWAGKNIAQIVGAVTGGKRPALPADTAPQLRALIDRCWAQDPAARPTAAALVGELQQLCQGAEAAASPPPSPASLAAEAERRAQAAEAEARAQRARADAEALRAAALEADLSALRLREAEAAAAASPAPPSPLAEDVISPSMLGSAALKSPAAAVDLLRRGGRQADIAELACEALFRAASTPAGAGDCVAAGAVPAIAAVLNSHPSEAALAEIACRALLGMLKHCPAAKEACGAGGAVRAIAAALARHAGVEAVASKACLALLKITDGNPAAKAVFVAAGVVPSLVATIEASSASGDAQVFALQTLANLGLDEMGRGR